MKPHAINLPLFLPLLLLLTLIAIVSYYNQQPSLPNSYNYIRKPSPSSSTATFPPPSDPPPPPPPPPSPPPPSPPSPPPPSPPSPPPPSPPPPTPPSPSPPPPRYPSIFRLPKGCDVTRGEWISDPDAPYYTNKTCYSIQEHQNCLKYGRPDSDFLKWRWKPAACELPAFDALQFLELVRGKSMAFVGDSLARNHMQSLMCLLSKVAYPQDISNTTDDNFKRLLYPTHNFTLSIFWSAFLVRAHQPDPDGPTHTSLWHLHLDEPDPAWASQIHQFTHVVVSTGNWFTRPSLYYRNRRLIGCNYWGLANVTCLNLSYSHRASFRTALGALTASLDRGSKLFLRTVSPSHFEGGEWNSGGDCRRRRPLRAGEARLEGMNPEMYEAQVEEFRAAATAARERRLVMRLLDTTWAMSLRPDGHPSRFGHWPHENVTMYNDCVHWCLPGPIDMWSQLLFVML